MNCNYSDWQCGFEICVIMYSLALRKTQIQKMHHIKKFEGIDTDSLILRDQLAS